MSDEQECLCEDWGKIVGAKALKQGGPGGRNKGEVSVREQSRWGGEYRQRLISLGLHLDFIVKGTGKPMRDLSRDEK